MNIHVSIVTMVLSATVIVIVTNTEHATLPITLGSLQPIQLLLVACLLAGVVLLAGVAGVYMKNHPVAYTSLTMPAIMPAQPVVSPFPVS